MAFNVKEIQIQFNKLSTSFLEKRPQKQEIMITIKFRISSYISYKFTTTATYNNCSIRMVVIYEAASTVEEIRFINKHKRLPLSTKCKVTYVLHIQCNVASNFLRPISAKWVWFQ